MADDYFVLSYLWVSVIMSINTGLFCCVTRWNWQSDEFAKLTAAGSDPNIDKISRNIGIVAAAGWILVNLRIYYMATHSSKWRCRWAKVVQAATEEDIDSYTEHQDDELVNKDTGKLDKDKMGKLD